MRFSGRAAFLLFLALFLICACFADDKKADGKGDAAATSASNDSSAQPPAGTTADATVTTPASDSPGSQPLPPAPPAKGSSSGGGAVEEAPRWDPVPALDGSPGLFTLETGEMLPRTGVAAAISVNKISRMPGSITILQTVPAISVGITDRFSVFFQLEANEHIHIDTPSQLSLNLTTPPNPQLGTTIYKSFLPGTGLPAAYVEDFPFASQSGSGGVGEADLGFKVGLFSERKGNPLSLSIREDFYIPTETGLSNLLTNQVQGGAFNFGVGVEASKTVFHHSIVATLNWSYRFVRGESFQVETPLGLATETLNRSDQMQVGFGMLMFPGKRINIITEYSGLIYIGSGIPNTTFGPRDPVDNVTGLRLHLTKEFALDLGYRYALDLTNHLDRNGFIVKLAGVYWPEKPREPDILNASCSVDRSVVMQGAYVQASASATDSYGHPLTYLWTADAGDMDGSGPYARWNSGSAAPGTHTLTARVDNGAGKTTSCSATVTVQPKPAPAPTMSCSADPSTVLAGARPQVTANVNDSSGTALAYSWQSNGGQVIGTGSSVQLDTSGLAPGNYTVTGRVENGVGKAADCSAGVTVQAPPPPPEAAKIGECFFLPNSARVDNICKRTLDDLAIRLQSDPKGRAVLVGFADPKESHAARLAGQRADSAGKFLGTKQGVDRTRVDIRSSTGSSTEPRQNRRLDLVWVPDGATF